MANLLEIAKKVKALRNIKRVELLELLQQSTAVQLQTTETQYIIVHPSINKNYKYQISTFDKKGAVMDGKYHTINEAVEELLRGMGYNREINQAYYRYKVLEVVKND